jgi:DNA polymerase elongation subunit (family B)
MHYIYRLLAFEPLDMVDGFGPKEFRIKMFGINERGQTATIIVKNYTPFFYVKVGDDWTESTKAEFVAQIGSDLGGAKFITSANLVNHKKLYGFDGGKEYKFVHLNFLNEAAMKKAKSLWYISSGGGGDGDKYERHLNPQGYMFEETSTILYEAQIPPLLRLFHIKKISPSGWIALPRNKISKPDVKTTTCVFEYTIDYKHIIPLPKKETRVPYKICSFDIEASSSHGDFPQPKKDYTKLAMNIVNICSKKNRTDVEFLKELIMAAFFDKAALVDKALAVDKAALVDKVYPLNPVSIDQIEQLFEVWIKSKPRQCKTAGDLNLGLSGIDEEHENENGEDGDDDDDDEEPEPEPEPEPSIWKNFRKAQPYKKNGTIIDVLTDKDVTRDTKLLELTRTLSEIFPPLQGDIVTFIGSTFMRYGADTPYLNHCIVLDTCAPVANAVIESYKTEKDVLLAWTRLIQKENPDIVIGYNIFGFDYQFMFLRAKELKCEREFLRLSRNKNEVCLKRNWKNGEESLEENTVMIASGQHDLKFVKMTGRLQIDLYNYFRRDYNLSQYKLDYVGGYFIGDEVKKLEHLATGQTKIYSKNLTGLANGNFINFEEEAHSVDAYKNGKKFEVSEVDRQNNTFLIASHEYPDLKKKVRWGLAKDDITPQDIFRMTNEGPEERAVIAKYCIQDCNLVQHLMRKIDVMTGYIEMANLCSVPLDFLVMRGQSIKLTSYIAKECRAKGILMPVLDKANSDEGYEGACVLEPKCNLYMDDPVACLDYSSLYPSSMISENISHDSKVLTREYDINGQLIAETGQPEYDNLPGYSYVDIEYNTYKWQHKNNNPKAKMEQVKVGYKICRYAQYPNNEKAIMPSILQELLAARKRTRKQGENHPDEFMRNILDKRQLSIKVTANSLYGQTGAKTSSFYDKDCAASTTAIGRKMLTYAKRVIEEAYVDQIVPTSQHGLVKTHAEYVYGDTDSVFFKFNLRDPTTDVPIIGQKALEITIELAQQAGNLATKFLKGPHDLEYEKTFLPFCLLSKKRYVGMLYEKNPHKCKRKSMGIVLKRRDNAPIVKDVYGGVIDILMKEKNVELAIKFLRECLQNLVEEKCGMDKLMLSKSLKSDYKKPEQIAHNVLANRIGVRDPGNKPANGDRIQFVFIKKPYKSALQGECIETPEYILANNLKIDYSHYIEKQIMKPLQQLFALVLEDMKEFKKKKGVTLRTWHEALKKLRVKHPKAEEYIKKENALRNKEVKALLFDPYIIQTNNIKNGDNIISNFFKTRSK